MVLQDSRESIVQRSLKLSGTLWAYALGTRCPVLTARTVLPGRIGKSVLRLSHRQIDLAQYQCCVARYARWVPRYAACGTEAGYGATGIAPRLGEHRTASFILRSVSSYALATPFPKRLGLPTSDLPGPMGLRIKPPPGVNAAIALRAPYAIPGTDAAYAPTGVTVSEQEGVLAGSVLRYLPTRALRGVQKKVDPLLCTATIHLKFEVEFAISLRACYAMPGTDPTYGATQALRGYAGGTEHELQSVRGTLPPYALSSTDVAHSTVPSLGSYANTRPSYAVCVWYGRSTPLSALSGTDTAHPPTRCPALRTPGETGDNVVLLRGPRPCSLRPPPLPPLHHRLVWYCPPTALPALRYALPSSPLFPTRYFLRQLRYYPTVSCYTVSATDLRYAATRRLGPSPTPPQQLRSSPLLTTKYLLLASRVLRNLRYYLGDAATVLCNGFGGTDLSSGTTVLCYELCSTERGYAATRRYQKS
eukprot:997395-Rhodomonas_salina.4